MKKNNGIQLFLNWPKGLQTISANDDDPSLIESCRWFLFRVLECHLVLPQALTPKAYKGEFVLCIYFYLHLL